MGRPLDKQEAISYGHFVDALYAMFKRDGNLPAPSWARRIFPCGTNWWHQSSFVCRVEKQAFRAILSKPHSESTSSCSGLG